MQIVNCLEKRRRTSADRVRGYWSLLTCVQTVLALTAIATFCLFTGTGSWAQSAGKSRGQSTVAGPKDDVKQAERLAEAGDRAAADGKWQETLADYAQAVKAAPGNAGILRRAAVMRARAVQTLVDGAEKSALDGNVDTATNLMREALRIDPGNTIVAERLAQLQQMPKEYLPVGDKQDYEMKGAAVLRPQPGKKSVNMRGDSKSAYEQLGQLFGIKVAFDPDLISRNVRLRVDNVDFHTAIQVLGVESKSFYRVVNPTLIFVADDTIAKRKEYSEELEQTFRLDNAIAPEDMTELLRVVREITNSTRISMDSKNHSLTLRETADKVALAGQLIKELEQARRDVMLDIELLEVDRNMARTLGITPPSNVQAFPLNTKDVKQLEAATDLSNLLTLVSQIFTAKGITASPNDVLPVGGGRSTFLLTMPSASAKFSDGLSLVRSGREILMRAQDAKPATFFVGERFPVTLSLLSTSLGGTTIGGAVTSTVFPRTDFAVGQDPVAVVAQDFNNDAKPDLAIANKSDSSISILLNNDNGNFTVAPGSPIKLGTNEQLPSAIASKVFRATDATHLAQPADLIIANSSSNTVSVLLGSGNFDGTFTEAAGSPLTVGAKPSAVVIADFNGDGNLDFAVANQSDNTISVFRGDSLGNFTEFPKSPFALPASEKGPIAMVSGAFDNSAKPEIAVL
ncbi:MAG TPA: FG-GAP-like repeat-containing protein, partial [Verrucomicrobiae bacterium]|nr:FG-GAP-like repeat-containing protein [Verrucomicrobiae bacterium]